MNIVGLMMLCDSLLEKCQAARATFDSVESCEMVTQNAIAMAVNEGLFPVFAVCVSGTLS